MIREMIRYSYDQPGVAAPDASAAGGAARRHEPALPQQTPLDISITDQPARLAQLQAREAALQQTADAFYAQPPSVESYRWFCEIDDEWRALSKEIERLETALRGRPAAPAMPRDPAGQARATGLP